MGGGQPVRKHSYIVVIALVFNRLVTASESGEIKVWNFNNGHCLIELDKGT